MGWTRKNTIKQSSSSETKPSAKKSSRHKLNKIATRRRKDDGLLEDAPGRGGGTPPAPISGGTEDCVGGKAPDDKLDFSVVSLVFESMKPACSVKSKRSARKSKHAP